MDELPIGLGIWYITRNSEIAYSKIATIMNELLPLVKQLTDPDQVRKIACCDAKGPVLHSRPSLHTFGSTSLTVLNP